MAGFSTPGSTGWGKRAGSGPNPTWRSPGDAFSGNQRRTRCEFKRRIRANGVLKALLCPGSGHKRGAFGRAQQAGRNKRCSPVPARFRGYRTAPGGTGGRSRRSGAAWCAGGVVTARRGAAAGPERLVPDPVLGGWGGPVGLRGQRPRRITEGLPPCGLSLRQGEGPEPGGARRVQRVHHQVALSDRVVERHVGLGGAGHGRAGVQVDTRDVS